MTQIRLAQSSAATPSARATEVTRQLAAGGGEAALVLVFCAPELDLAASMTALREALPTTTRLMGCTTAGEIGPAGFQNASLVALALPADDFVAAVALLPELSAMDLRAWQEGTRDLLRRHAENLAASGFPSSFGILLVDGLSTREEPLARTIKMEIGSIPLVGGSAGDGLRFRRTWVCRDGTTATDAAVLALVATRRPFRAFKTQHFVRARERMVVTAARPAERVVTEINGFPAALEFARIVGIDVAQLSPFSFAAHPVVVRVGGAEYVRSIQKVNPDHSLTFYCAIDEGMVLCTAEGVDAIDNLTGVLADIESRIGRPEAVLACDCILRNLEFQKPEVRDVISRLMRENRFLGFSTYGEQFEGVHVNQTLTGIAFGEAR